jgi:hypothetical protein
MAPIDDTFRALEPTRIPISSPFITSSGPMFIFMPLISVPGIPAIGLAEGLAEGIGIFISGDACGLGEAAGIGMLGM